MTTHIGVIRRLIPAYLDDGLPGDYVADISNQCDACAHQLEDLCCDAFPEGIPDIIRLGMYDHTEFFPGDKGIVFVSAMEGVKEASRVTIKDKPVRIGGPGAGGGSAEVIAEEPSGADSAAKEGVPPHPLLEDLAREQGIVLHPEKILATLEDEDGLHLIIGQEEQESDAVLERP